MGTHCNSQPASALQAPEYRHPISDNDAMWLQRGRRLGGLVLALLRSYKASKRPAAENRLGEPAQ